MSNTWIVDIGFYRDSTFVQLIDTLVFYYTHGVKKRKKYRSKITFNSIHRKLHCFFFLSEKIETGSVEKKKRKKGEDRNRTYFDRLKHCCDILVKLFIRKTCISFSRKMKALAFIRTCIYPCTRE